MPTKDTNHIIAMRVFTQRGEYDPATKRSRIVPMNKFVKAGCADFGNGGSWARDSQWPKHNIRRLTLKDLDIECPEEAKKIRDAKGVADLRMTGIVALQLMGEKKNPISQYIRADIRQALFGTPSAFDGTRGTQIDHKDGRKDWHLDSASQKLEDFQSVTASQNVVKREFCKRCKDTGMRFDAKERGFSFSQTLGGPRYEGTCTGCYLYDPIAFAAHTQKLTQISGVS